VSIELFDQAMDIKIEANVQQSLQQAFDFAAMGK